MTREQPHSADYFGSQRDFWWNGDFLDLMAQRLGLAQVRRILDVGCGVGHWSRQILPRCHPQAALLGIDREPVWIERARGLMAPVSRARFEVGDALELVQWGGGFDLITCQTVLIHLQDPARVIAAMVSQLVPGGLLAVAEPNNLTGSLVTDSLSAAESMDERLSRLRFQWTCERGKRQLGLGDNSLGDQVPELLARAGLTDIQVYNSDKVALLSPPYDSPEQVALVEDIFDQEQRDFAGWDRDTAQSYYLAGGGDATAFEQAWHRERARVLAIAAAVRAGTYYSNATGVFYLASGRAPI